LPARASEFRCYSALILLASSEGAAGRRGVRQNQQSQWQQFLIIVVLRRLSLSAMSAVVLSAMFSEVVDSERCAVVRDEWLPTRENVADSNDAGY
jgi:hypothetical protein